MRHTDGKEWWKAQKIASHDSNRAPLIQSRKLSFKLTSFANFFFFLVSWGGARLSLLFTAATKWHIVPAVDDRWWVWSSRWNENWQGKPEYSEKTCPSATSSTTIPTCLDLGSNPGRRFGKPATNRLSYGTAVCKLYMQLYLSVDIRVHRFLLTVKGYSSTFE
jgi:hypothetical protein